MMRLFFAFALMLVLTEAVRMQQVLPVEDATLDGERMQDSRRVTHASNRFEPKDTARPSTPMHPDSTKRDWYAADNFCRSQHARLPTREELVALWRTAVVARPSCSKPDAPLVNSCNGQSEFYWSGTAAYGSGGHYAARTTDGSLHGLFDHVSIQVICVR